jgi:hypothetical protein
MSIWRDLKDGIRDAVIGLQYLGREHVTNEEIAAAQRELDRNWEPERWVSVPLDELDPERCPQYYDPEWGQDPTAAPERGPRYYPDGRIVSREGRVLAFGISIEHLTEVAERELGDREIGG